MRCTSCAKFVSYEGDEDPEVEDVRINREGELEVEIRIVKRCGECWEELKEASFTLVEDLTTALESEGIPVEEWEDLFIKASGDATEEIRKGIQYYGVSVTWEVREHGTRLIAGPGEIHEDIAASAMDEMQ